ncbi:MAG: hypothetical protein J6M30_02970 [Bacteroidales bacterium]|nr:hypothetical protein [Bacteroidales bacterium]
MKKYGLVIFVALLFSFGLKAQKSYNMVGFEMQLKPLMEEMFSADKDNERFAANEKFISELEDALLFEKSFAYSFPALDKISILTAPDKSFRIFTWAIVNQSGEWENYGFVQSKNNVTGEYELSRLFDKSRDAISPEEEKLNDSTWYGAVYYDLIANKHEGKTYYILLGWNGNDIYSQKKIIEPISFRQNAKPVFGQQVFYKDKQRMRYIFEYSTDAEFTLKYDDQYYEISTNQKAKSTLLHKAQPFEKEAAKTEKQRMIFFDELEPTVYGMDGLTQYYVPSGEVTGLYFDNGRWKKLKYNVLPRNKAEKNDAYTPDETKIRGLFPVKH